MASVSMGVWALKLSTSVLTALLGMLIQSSLTLTLLLLQIQRLLLCQHIHTMLKKLSENNEVPPPFASSPLWEHAAAAAQ